MDVFFSDDDRRAYIRFLSEQGKRFGLRYLAWCLMTNHVHLIVIPETQTSLAKGIGEAHKRYTRMIDFREGWRSYLFQGRFFWCPLEESYAIAAIRYVLRNPVRAKIVTQAWSYRWSNAVWLVGDKEDDPLVKGSSLFQEVDNWRDLLSVDPDESNNIRLNTTTGRPIGDRTFVESVEQLTGRTLRVHEAGRRPDK